MIWIKKHGEVLAACDENIIGKRFSDGELELHLNEKFYKGKLVEEGKSKKVNVVKYLQKSRYLKTRGHRQPYAKIEITKI